MFQIFFRTLYLQIVSKLKNLITYKQIYDKDNIFIYENLNSYVFKNKTSSSFSLISQEIKTIPLDIILDVETPFTCPIGSTLYNGGGYGLSDLLLTIYSDKIIIHNQGPNASRWSTPFSVIIPKM